MILYYQIREMKIIVYIYIYFFFTGKDINSLMSRWSVLSMPASGKSYDYTYGTLYCNAYFSIIHSNVNRFSKIEFLYHSRLQIEDVYLWDAWLGTVEISAVDNDNRDFGYVMY